MKVEPTTIPGCKALYPDVRADVRGRFVKVYQDRARTQLGSTHGPPLEIYHSTSRQGVIRGMHFQLPPAEHDKLVYCLAGTVTDTVVDLRRGSPTYQQYTTIELSGETGNGICVPVGCAHGFATTSPKATLLYLVTSEHKPELDTGIRWDSAGIDWPIEDPIVSQRDSQLPAMADFDSPFTYSRP